MTVHSAPAFSMRYRGCQRHGCASCSAAGARLDSLPVVGYIGGTMPLRGAAQILALTVITLCAACANNKSEAKSPPPPPPPKPGPVAAAPSPSPGPGPGSDKPAAPAKDPG